MNFCYNLALGLGSSSVERVLGKNEVVGPIPTLGSRLTGGSPWRRRLPMYYVYILKSLKDNKLYVGKTSDLKKRLFSHNSGKVISTKNRRPLELLFYEAFKNKTDAGRDELFFKSGYGREVIKDKLLNSLK